MLGLVNRPNNISLSRANQSQAKFKSVVGGNLLQSWVNLTIVRIFTDIQNGFAKSQHMMIIFSDLQKDYDTTWRYDVVKQF